MFSVIQRKWIGVRVFYNIPYPYKYYCTTVSKSQDKIFNLKYHIRVAIIHTISRMNYCTVLVSYNNSQLFIPFWSVYSAASTPGAGRRRQQAESSWIIILYHHAHDAEWGSKTSKMAERRKAERRPWGVDANQPEVARSSTHVDLPFFG